MEEIEIYAVSVWITPENLSDYLHYLTLCNFLLLEKQISDTSQNACYCLQVSASGRNMIHELNKVMVKGKKIYSLAGVDTSVKFLIQKLQDLQQPSKIVDITTLLNTL